MPSYQDIEQRLKVVEDRLAFVMLTFRFPHPLAPPGSRETVSLLDLYFQAYQEQQKAKIVDTSADKVTENGPNSGE